MLCGRITLEAPREFPALGWEGRGSQEVLKTEGLFMGIETIFGRKSLLLAFFFEWMNSEESWNSINTGSLCSSVLLFYPASLDSKKSLWISSDSGCSG